MSTINLQTYWKMAPTIQKEFLTEFNQAELEAYAEKHCLLVYDGRLVNPEDYPCTCELQDPEQCFQDNKDFPDNEWSKQSVELFLKAQEDETCPCPCHRYYEPY